MSRKLSSRARRRAEHAAARVVGSAADPHLAVRARRRPPRTGRIRCRRRPSLCRSRRPVGGFAVVVAAAPFAGRIAKAAAIDPGACAAASDACALVAKMSATPNRATLLADAAGLAVIVSLRDCAAGRQIPGVDFTGLALRPLARHCCRRPILAVSCRQCPSFRNSHHCATPSFCELQDRGTLATYSVVRLMSAC